MNMHRTVTSIRKKAIVGWFLAALTIAVLGCIDAFDAGVAAGGSYLVVDATFDNSTTGRAVKLSTSSQPYGTPTLTSITNAQVQIQAVGGLLTSLIGVAGTYSVPTAFSFTPGTTYKLLIQLSDGKKYESGLETMPTPVVIQKLYRTFDPEGYQVSTTANTKAGAENLLVDFQDPANESNYYQWTYTLWERQTTCTSCTDGLYNNSTNKCTSFTTNATFDYACLTDCWEVLRNQSINTTSDALFNGKLLTGRLAGVVPYYQPMPCLISLSQRSLTPGGYRYAVILGDQSQNTGGLADTPGASLQGNVRNLADSGETVLGYFSVSGVSRVLYWNDRSEVPAKTQPIGLLGGRLYNPEPAGTYGPLRPPLAPCTASSTRTPVKPVGWQN